MINFSDKKIKQMLEAERNNLNALTLKYNKVKHGRNNPEKEDLDYKISKSQMRLFQISSFYDITKEGFFELEQKLEAASLASETEELELRLNNAKTLRRNVKLCRKASIRFQSDEIQLMIRQRNNLVSNEQGLNISLSEYLNEGKTSETQATKVKITKIKEERLHLEEQIRLKSIGATKVEPKKVSNIDLNNPQNLWYKIDATQIAGLSKLFPYGFYAQITDLKQNAETILLTLEGEEKINVFPNQNIWVSQ